MARTEICYLINTDHNSNVYPLTTAPITSSFAGQTQTSPRCGRRPNRSRQPIRLVSGRNRWRWTHWSAHWNRRWEGYYRIGLFSCPSDQDYFSCWFTKQSYKLEPIFTHKYTAATVHFILNNLFVGVDILKNILICRLWGIVALIFSELFGCIAPMLQFLNFWNCSLSTQNKEIEELTKICDELIAKMGKS